MTDHTRVAIVATSTTPSYDGFNGPEPAMIMTVVNEILASTGIDRHDIGFTIAGSCDYLSGMPFAFVSNIDGMGAWPPVYESHVEMDGAWALFEAWIRLQLGDDVKTALVVGSGKSSPGNHREAFPLQTDPYVGAPLGLDPVSVAGLQASALVRAGKATEADFAASVLRSRAARGAADTTAEELLAAPYVAAPLRAHDVAPLADGAAALLIATEDVAGQYTDSPIWIEGIDHRIDSHFLNLRDLTVSASTKLAAENLDLGRGVDIAELCNVYSHEETILRDAMGLGDATSVNPSGGALAANPVMATGLTRVIEVADRLGAGDGERGVAHASSGPALQQNLLCTMEVV